MLFEGCLFGFEVLYELYFGLAEATKKHAPTVASLIASARYVTARREHPLEATFAAGKVAFLSCGGCHIRQERGSAFKVPGSWARPSRG